MGNILDFEHRKNRVEVFKLDIVVHLVAIGGVDTVMKYPVKRLKSKMIGTYNMLEAVKDMKSERFLNFSTSELAGEPLAYAYHKEFGIQIVSIRPLNVYEPGQVGEGAIHKFVVRGLKNELLEIHGDGNQIRSRCYIDDFVDANREDVSVLGKPYKTRIKDTWNSS